MEGGNPFEGNEEEDEDSLDELEGKPVQLRRRRTVPSKVASRLDVDIDNPWRTSTALGNLPGYSRRRSPDTAVPLKAQKTLGIANSGRLLPQDDYRRTHSLSPQTENVAPKAQRMLGIPSNPFQKRPTTQEDRHFFHDELEREGSRGPTTTAKKPMDVDEFKRLLLSGERNPNFHRNFRDSSSNTDISSLSRSSILSSQPDTHIETPRSSHEFATRPPLTRIATDPAVSANMLEPWTNKPFSPVEIGDSSPVLNKPLPKTPEHTFELAGSEPVHSTKRKGPPGVPESIAELPDPQMMAELPGEPIIHEMPASVPEPGSSAAPIELPAREASPIDPPSFKSSSLFHFTQNRNVPVPPPPRRSGSQGSSRQGSIERTLSTQSSESSLSQTNKPTLPPTRGSSTRLDRAIANALPPSNIPSPEVASTSSSSKSVPMPPPSRPGGSSDSSEASTTKPSSNESSTERPTTPTGPQPKASAKSPLSRLPPLQTKPKTDTPYGTPIADSMVSAITNDTNSKASSPSGMSTLSPSSPASRRAGLNLISKAAGRKDSELKEKGSKEELKPRPRERKQSSHQREWSWEPGKVDRIDSIKRSEREANSEERAAEDNDDEEKEDSGSPQKLETVIENEPETAAPITHEPSKLDVLADLDKLRQDVDVALKDQAGVSTSEEASPVKQEAASLPGVEDKYGVEQEPRNKAKSETAVAADEAEEGNKVPQGNWI
ncbi:MAG: hypothetical protein MMC23_006283 [Stictis urceolatum]|nr:hypothetical protein [Stictis urceolata]